MIMKELGGLGLLTNERLTLFSKQQVILHSITLQNVHLTPLTFVENNRNLKFLGVAHCVNYKAIERLSVKYSSIEIIGGMSETQLIKTLQYYGPHRKIFISETLYFVSDLVRRGHYFSPTFFEFVAKFLEDELKNKCYVYSAVVIYCSDDDDSESSATSSTQEVENDSIYSDIDGDENDASSVFDEDNDDFGDPDGGYSESGDASYEDSSGSEGDGRENDDASSSDEDDDGSVGFDDDADGDYSESKAALFSSNDDSGEYGANGNGEVDDRESDDASFSDVDSRDSDFDTEDDDRESDVTSTDDGDSDDDNGESGNASDAVFSANSVASDFDDAHESDDESEDLIHDFDEVDDTFERMSECELAEIVTNSSYICTSSVRKIYPVCTLILEKVKLNEDLAETAIHLRDILKIRKSNADFYIIN
ncbi:unnamed protein product [Hymenolepis diminuta]|uniref:Uncharacterized protein n=1 Tax=Hymenolepis diminuta TaxID=6216 RepID=A0A564YP26_HYMDI|nr:unnamed protein product [Hymenolepis diminuta]